MTQIPVLGITYHALTKETVSQALELLRKKPGGKSVVTAGTEHVMMARRNPDLLTIYNDADLVLADGVGVIKASRIIKTPLPERLSGIDVATSMFPVWAENGAKLFLLGGKSGMAARAVERLEKKYTGLEIVGAHDGYFTDNEKVLALLAHAKPDVLILCLGAPNQERWMMRYKSRVGDCLMMGLGGSIDVWAGEVRRAPRWVIRLSLEWFWRLVLQPWRITRVIKLPGILFLAKNEKRRLRKQAKHEQ